MTAAENSALSDEAVACVRLERAQNAFLARGEAALQAFLRNGRAVPAEAVLAELQSRLDQRRQALPAGPNSPTS